jgi:hypothetical protein
VSGGRAVILVLAGCDVALGLEPPAPDATAPSCGQRDVELVPDTGLVETELSTLVTDDSGSCGGAGVADAVYAIDLPLDGTGLMVATDLPGTTSDTLIYVRRDCLDPTSEIVCDVRGGRDELAAHRLDRLARGRYYVFVDGEGAGAHVAVVIRALLPEGSACTANPAREVCAPNLECVDGHCRAAPCELEATLPPGGSTTTLATSGKPNRHAGTCGPGNDGGARAGEAIVAFTTAGGSVTVTTASATTDFDTIVYLRAACAGDEIACSDDAGAMGGASTLTASVPAGSYHVFVDGFAGATGTAQLIVSAP